MCGVRGVGPDSTAQHSTACQRSTARRVSATPASTGLGGVELTGRGPHVRATNTAALHVKKGEQHQHSMKC